MTPLSDLLKRRVSPPRPPADREPLAVRQAAERIRQRWPDVQTEDPETDLETLVVDMDRRRRNNDWRGFYWSDATQTALALFDSDRWRRFSGLRRFLIRQIGPDTNRPFIRAMFKIYLDTFDSRSTHTKELARALGAHWAEAGLPIERLVHRFRIFDADASVARRIAVYMEEATDPFHSLRREGLEAPHGPGLMESVHRHFVSRLKRPIASGQIAAVEKLLGWLKPGADHTPLRGPGAGIALDALLSPWAKGVDPGPQIRKLIQTRSVKAYGDPRADSTNEWNACSAEARNVILRWLAGETIGVFFDIVTKVDPSHMWPDRKDLWIGLYRENRMAEAWFALSNDGAHVALHRGGDLKFARNMSHAAEDRRKCLLIMKVDGRQVVEGSHNFPTWVFPKGSPMAVEPYGESYTCEQFRRFRNMSGRGKPEDIWHHPKIWRNNVLAALER